ALPRTRRVRPRQDIRRTRMHFISTRGQVPPTPIDAALVAGLAPDGGLYVPERIPALADWSPLPTLPATARRTLAPYFAGSMLRDRREAICADAFSFGAPLRPLAGAGDHVLELFHGPAAAFKDYAARFLARALEGLREPDAPPTTILVPPRAIPVRPWPRPSTAGRASAS